eukprot:1677402-Alexandrium_andersonii.AAC.1
MRARGRPCPECDSDRPSSAGTPMRTLVRRRMCCKGAGLERACAQPAGTARAGCVHLVHVWRWP